MSLSKPLGTQLTKYIANNSNKKNFLFVVNKKLNAQAAIIFHNNKYQINNKLNNNNGQLRYLQTLTKEHNPGYWDDLIGTYKFGPYHMDLKPWEFRDGQPLYYFSFVGISIISFSIGFAIFCAFWFGFWYLYSSPVITVWRKNPHPFLAIRNGYDMNKLNEPLFQWTVKYTIFNRQDNKMMFFRELERARNHTL
ncbi:hypothetical protein ABK040_010938 [Willaertia magna]